MHGKGFSFNPCDQFTTSKALNQNSQIMKTKTKLRTKLSQPKHKHRRSHTFLSQHGIHESVIQQNPIRASSVQETDKRTLLRCKTKCISKGNKIRIAPTDGATCKHRRSTVLRTWVDRVGCQWKRLGN